MQRLTHEAPRPEGEPTGPPRVGRAPSLLSLVGAAVAMGVAAGFLELAVFAFQVHGLDRVDLTSLRISRHAAWMIPVAEALVTIPLALALVAPGLAWAGWRSRRGRAATGWAWGWAGTVLGSLLVLGPLMAVRGLHAVAALVLAVGLGFRLRRLVARPSPGWSRAARWAGVIAAVVLPSYALWQWDRAARAGEPAAPPPPAGAPNVLWIVMDTVRADRLSLYGYGRPTTPNLERWSGQALTFDEARSAAPWTLPSHVSMFTGLWPYQQGARIDRSYRGPRPTIAEHLGSRGYATAGFVANTGMCNACFGVGRGFGTYVELLCNHEVSLRATMLNSALGARTLKALRRLGLDVPTQFPYPARSLAPTILAWGRQWLDGLRPSRASSAPAARRPFFLFLNFMDAHGPYYPASNAARVFSADRPLPPRKWANPTTGSQAVRALKAARPEDRPRLREELEAKTRLLGDLYDDCLLGLDAQIGRFLDELRDSGTLADTWVVLTADHGEYFGEHDLFGHGGRLHNEVTRVPLMLIPPLGQAADGTDPASALRGRRLDAPVSLCDLPATLAELLEPGAAHPFPGQSLSRFWSGAGPAPADPILMQMEEQPLEGDDVTAEGIAKTDAVIDDGHVLIASSNRPAELYRLDDRAQRHDLAADPAQRARIARMRRALNGLLSPDSR